MQKKTDYSYLKHLNITVTFMVFDMHTDHLISARRPELIIINKTKGICKIVDFASIHGKKKTRKQTMGRKNNCTDISSNKQAKYHMRWFGHGWKTEALREKLNPFK